MLVGGFVALYQTDLKRILAYSTVSALGFLVMLLGIGSPLATTAAMTFLLAHALYKGALFMTAGAIDHESGTRDVERLGGLRAAMPWTAAAAGLAALSLAGFGPLLSFIGKELAFEAALDRDAGVVLAAAILLAGVSFVAVAGLNAVRPFFGPLRDTPKKPHEASASLWLPPLLLAVLGILFGVAPMLVDDRLVAPAASAALGHASHEHLALWHGLNLPLALSTLSLVLGVATYLAWGQLRAATSRWAEPVMARGPERGYELVLAGLNAISLLHTRVVQNGYLRAYLVVTVGVVAGLGGYTLLAKGNLEGPGGWSDVRLYHIAIAALMLVAAFTTATSPSRLVAVASLGVVGYGVALTYIVYGAPDLAMTQFMVETLTVILFLAVLYHLPRLRGLSSGLARVRDAVIALSAGAFVTALVLVTSASRQPSAVATYYAEESVSGGHGRNIVNVILVDFRALDTLGEITVLAVAAFGVYALLKYRPSRLRRGPRFFGGIAAPAGKEGEGE
jgi:multicomponent Na+:H+ antiporter subunit A